MSAAPDYSSLLFWITEREAIRKRREAGLPPPWTDNEVMATHRFCNVARERDRVTIWIRHNIREKFAGHQYLWLMLVIGRLINRPETMAELIERGAWPTNDTFDPKSLAAVMDDRTACGEPNFNGAYKTGMGGQGTKRNENAALTVRDLWGRRAEFADLFASQATLQRTHAELKKARGLGDFIAYQAVVDMRFTPLLASASDVSSWSAAGPGTIRGLNRIHGRPVKLKISQQQALRELRPMFGYVREQLPDVPLDFSDAANCACELDKFLRFTKGEREDGSKAEGGGKKGNFKPASEPLPVANDGYTVASAPPSGDAGPLPLAKPPRVDETKPETDAPPPENDDPPPSAKAPAPETEPDFDDARPGDANPYADDGKPHLLFCDFETRSACNLKTAGAYVYVADPTTDVWCCAYAVDDGPVMIWTPSDLVPPEFVEAARNPNWKVVAFNAQFERLIAAHVMTPRYGWPAIRVERFACLQASSLAHALPTKGLGAVALALGLEEKDAEGAKLMREMAKPRTATLDEDPNTLHWYDDPDRLARLYEYCKRDIVVTQALYNKIGLLPDAEHVVWLLDQRINDRGLPVDRTLAEGAVALAASASAAIDAEMEELTAGAVASPRQVDNLLAWCASQGAEVASAKKPDIATALKRDDLPAALRRVLELRAAGAHVAGSKFKRVLRQISADNRVRGTYSYHGAHTGRFSARGVQPQNLRKPPKDFNIAEAVSLISAGDYDALKQRFSHPLDAIGNVVRAAFAAPPGRRLFAADFSGVESRVLAWLSGETSKLKLWADFDAGGTDPYLALGRLLGLPEDTARAGGKVGDLAFGFGGGKGAFRRFGDPNATDEEIRRLQQAWRDAHPHTVAFWRALERGALRAVATPNTVARVSKIAFCARDGFLRMRLPSGRCIAYPFPQIEDVVNKFGKPQRVVTYEGHTLTRKWTRLQPWFGIFVENVVQATARDLLVEAMLRLDAKGYAVIAHTHDEIVSETDGFGSAEEFAAIMTTLPEWADGLPISAKARSGPRFIEIDGSDEAPTISADEIEDEEPRAVDDAPSIEDEDDAPPWDVEGEPLLEVEAPSAPASPVTPDRHLPSSLAASTKTDRPLPSSAPPRHNGYDRDEDDYFKQRRSGSGQVLARYYYNDPDGRHYHRKDRLDTHKFPHYHFDAAKGIWVKGKPPSGVYYPYGLRRLLAGSPDTPIWVTEGEKDADNLTTLGLIAVCNPNGGGNFSGDFTREQLESWFRGRKVVYAPEDNDAKGLAHVDDIGQALLAFGCEVRVVPFRDMPEKADISDWLAQGHTREELLARPWTKWSPPELQSVCAADVVMRAMTWLWPDRFAVDELGIIAGLPDEGKGQVLAFIASTVTRGGLWPCGEGAAPKGNVVILSAEDGAEKTVVPRLKAAGADLSRVHLVQMVAARGKDGERMFSLVTDLNMLRQKIESIGNVALVLVDPISAYFGHGKVDSFRTTDVRSVLSPLQSLLRELGIAFIGIMHFNKKTDVTNALLRISDSLAFGATARHVYAVVNDAENDRKVMVKGKNNHAPSDQQALAYKFEVKDVGADPVSGVPIYASRIVWEPEHVDITALEAMAAANEGRAPGARDKAKKFLETELAAGPRLAKEMFEAADARDISKNTLKRAKSELGVVTKKEGDAWMWCLPEHEQQDAAPEAPF